MYKYFHSCHGKLLYFKMNHNFDLNLKVCHNVRISCTVMSALSEEKRAGTPLIQL